MTRTSPQKERAAALAVVLAVIGVVLTIGLAMGSLSTLSLQFNRQQVESLKEELAARSAVSEIMAQLRLLDEAKTEDALTASTETIVDKFPSGFLHQADGYTVKTHFQKSLPGYSTDNLGGDEAAVGWSDRSDEVPRIPPFALDLVLNIEGPTRHRKVRVCLKKVWPYAIYTTEGPIALCGVQGGSSERPSAVKGDVFTSWDGVFPELPPDIDPSLSGDLGYGVGPLISPSRMLANAEARGGYHPEKVPDRALMIGLKLGHRNVLSPVYRGGDSDLDRYYHFPQTDLPYKLLDSSSVYTFGQPPPQAPSTGPRWDKDITYFVPPSGTADRGNSLDGDFVSEKSGPSGSSGLPPWSSTSSGGSSSAVIAEGNTLTGKSRKARVPIGDPLESLWPENLSPEELFSGGNQSPLLPESLRDIEFQKLEFPSVGSELEATYGLNPAELVRDGDLVEMERRILLDKDLVLTESENSTGGPISTHYEIDGSISNRQVVYNKGESAEGPGIYVRERKVGMKLQNVTLHVKGDLDLGASTFGNDIQISGAGATIIAEGKLILGESTINAQDQGFVLMANHIILKAGGNFHGLLIARSSISILSHHNSLNVEGALLCAGNDGVLVQGANVKHEPRYLKSLNGSGEFTIASWADTN